MTTMAAPVHVGDTLVLRYDVMNFLGTSILYQGFINTKFVCGILGHGKLHEFLVLCGFLVGPQDTPIT